MTRTEQQAPIYSLSILMALCASMPAPAQAYKTFAELDTAVTVAQRALDARVLRIVSELRSQGKDWIPRKRACMELGKLRRLAAGALPQLIIAHEGDSSVEVRAAALDALTQLGKVAVPYLVRRLQDKRFRRAEYAAVLAMGVQLIDLLPVACEEIKALTPMPQDYAGAISANDWINFIGLLGPRAKKAAPLLEETIRRVPKDPGALQTRGIPWIHVYSLRALQEVGFVRDEQAIESIAGDRDHPAQKEASSLLEDLHDVRRYTMILEKGPDKDILDLLAQIQDPFNNGSIKRLANILEQEFVALLKHRTDSIRLAARLHLRVTARRETLVSLLGDPDKGMRGAALEALATRRPSDNYEIVKELLSIWKGDVDLRARAEVLILQIISTMNG